MRIFLALLPFVVGACVTAPPSPRPRQAFGPVPIPSAAPAPDARPTERTAHQKARDDARAALANAILSAYGNNDPELSPDRKKVLFGSRRDGNREVYLADVANPSAPPVAITRGPERAQNAKFTRDGKAVIFTRDTGADENYRIYMVGLDGNEPRCLTPGPVRKRSPPREPRDKPGTLVYTQRDAKSPATEIVIQRLEHEPNVVYIDPSPTTLRDVSRDGTRALILRRYSSSDYVLFELELEAGTTHRIYPAEGKRAAVRDATYSADGKRVYVAADDGAEGQFLFALDPKTGAVKGRYTQSAPATASVDRIIASPRGDRLAIVVDAGDHSEAFVLDAATLAVKAKVQAPLGTIALRHFSDDGAKIGATITRDDAPTDVFAIDAMTGAVEPLRDDARPGLEKLDKVETSIEAVKAFDGLSIPIIVHLPSGARASGERRPVLVEFHGGPAWSSSVAFNTFARFFTSLGYAYVEPNVRGSTGYGRAYEKADNREKRADWLRDLEAVNAWTKAQPWADPARVIAMGGSYGGYTVLMALTRQPALWRVGVDYVGIANLITLMKSTDQALRAVWVDEFGDLDKDRALLEEFSPLRDIDKIKAPLYVYAGQNDPRVPREESDQVVLALRERNVPVEYQVAADEGHSIDHHANRVEFLTRVARFLDDNAK